MSTDAVLVSTATYDSSGKQAVLGIGVLEPKLTGTGTEKEMVGHPIFFRKDFFKNLLF